MAHNPGDTVYTINSIRIDGETSRCAVELRYGVVDKNGNVVYRASGVSVLIPDELAASVRTAVAALVAGHLPTALAGAVPA